jgi:hypothetical protein
MTRINSIEELKAKQQELRSRKIVLESEIINDYEAFKLDLEPLKLLTKSAGKILVSKDNGILGNSLSSIADFITNNVLLKNSGLLTRLIIPYLVKNTTGNLVENNKSKITGWLSNKISKFVSEKKHKIKL